MFHNLQGQREKSKHRMRREVTFTENRVNQNNYIVWQTLWWIAKLKKKKEKRIKN